MYITGHIGEYGHSFFARTFDDPKIKHLTFAPYGPALVAGFRISWVS